MRVTRGAMVVHRYTYRILAAEHRSITGLQEQDWRVLRAGPMVVY